MALITCPECGKQISDQSKHCPYCGYPMQPTEEDSAPSSEPSPDQEPAQGKVISEIRPLTMVLLGFLLFVVLLWGTTMRSPSKHVFTDSDAFYCAQLIVKNELKSPSTAKFCKFSEATITHNDKEYMVTGYVDAQNSFGATLRNKFIVTFTATENGYKNGMALFFDN